MARSNLLPCLPPLVLVVVIALAAACGSDAGDTKLRLTLNVRSGEGAPASADADTLRSSVEDRLKSAGADSVEVQEQSGDTLVVTTTGVSEKDAQEAFTGVSAVQFQVPRTRERGRVVCKGADGAEFTVPPQFVTSEPSGNLTVLRCKLPDREGEIVWENAVGADAQGAQQALTLDLVDKVEVASQPTSSLVLQFSEEGKAVLADFTGRHVGLPLGIFVNAELVKAPLTLQPITEGRLIITGITSEEAQQLKDMLEDKTLPAPVQLVKIETME